MVWKIYQLNDYNHTVMTENSKDIDDIWRQRLVDLKAESGMSYQALAARLKMDPSNLYKSCQGKAKVPLATRVRYFDFFGFRSLRSAVLSALPKDAAESLLKRHDALITNTVQKKLRKLPEDALQALSEGNEKPAWVIILDRLKETYKTDQKLAEALGCTRPIIAIFRATGQRLPFEVKLRALDMTDFVVNDELLLSLLPVLVIDAIKEEAAKRPDPSFELPLDPRLAV